MGCSAHFHFLSGPLLERFGPSPSVKAASSQLPKLVQAHNYYDEIYRVCIGFILGYIGIMENKMETMMGYTRWRKPESAGGHSEMRASQYSLCRVLKRHSYDQESPGPQPLSFTSLTFDQLM